MKNHMLDIFKAREANAIIKREESNITKYIRYL